MSSNSDDDDDVSLDIASLSYRELQAECIKANVSAGGKAAVLRRRLRRHFAAARAEEDEGDEDYDDNEDGDEDIEDEDEDIEEDDEDEENDEDEDMDEDGDEDEDDENNNSNKRLKQTSLSDDLLCPITRDLPFDPVTAEDGVVYERDAILKHFETQRGRTDGIKSPVTNQKMGERLLPAVRTRNHIEALVENNVVNKELADSWTKRTKEKARGERLKKEAEEGDFDAMYEVGCMYMYGELWVREDPKLAYMWFKRAADQGQHVEAMAEAGSSLVCGLGVGENLSLAMLLLGMAAQGGSDMACCYLGIHFAQGSGGLPKDKSQAMHWLKEGVSCQCEHLHASEELLEEARRELEKLENPPPPPVVLRAPARLIELPEQATRPEAPPVLQARARVIDAPAQRAPAQAMGRQVVDVQYASQVVRENSTLQTRM